MQNLKNLLTMSNAKTSKGESLGYLTGILYMAPVNIVDNINVCPFASKGCAAACLYSAGRGRFSNVQAARRSKTELFRDNKDLFFKSLKWSIEKVIRKAQRENLIPVIRLNGTSDISYEDYKVFDGKSIFEIFPNIQFYDYTKNPYRFNPRLDNDLKNYHLTFSVNENNLLESQFIADLGYNIARVFDQLPLIYMAKTVINGDTHDLRFLDNSGVIVGLTAKGDAKHDTSGFVFRDDIDLKKVA
jgi:hypothetical protein